MAPFPDLQYFVAVAPSQISWRDGPQPLFLETSAAISPPGGIAVLCRPRLLFYFFATIVFFGLSTRARAGVHFQPISQEELKMTSEPGAPGAPAIILYREVNRDDYGISNRGGLRLVGNEMAAPASRFEEDYYRIKILTDAGRKYGNIEIPFDTNVGTVSGIMARTIRPDGSIVNFSGQILDKTLVKGRGLEWRAKTFALPEVQAGSIIEYFYTLNFYEGYFYGSRWILNSELFTKRAKFSLKPNHNDYTPVNFRWLEHLPAGSPPVKQDPDNSVHLEVTNVAAFQAEDFMPPENQLKARVEFVYSYESFESDASKFWKKFGKKRNDELESFIGKRGSLDSVVAQIVSPGDTPEAKLLKIYARVQQLPNTSYQTQSAVLAKRHELLATDDVGDQRNQKRKIENAEEIWRQGYGNSKQLNWLYVALTRAAGLETYGVLVSERRNYFFAPQSMQDGELDATAVLAKLDGKDVYVAPGAAFAPFGMLPWDETGVQGLRLDKDGGTWIKTSLPESSSSRIERKADLKLTTDGSLEGKLELTFTGLEALRRRVDQRNHDGASRRKFLEDEVAYSIPAGSEVRLVNEPDWNSSESSLAAVFDMKVPGWATATGNHILVPVGVFGATERNVFEYSTRTYPIYFEFPSEKSDDITIELPSGSQVATLPKPQNHDLHAVGYILSAESVKGELHLSRKLDVNVLEIDPKYYTALRSFYQGVKTADEQQIVLTAGASTAGN